MSTLDSQTEVKIDLEDIDQGICLSDAIEQYPSAFYKLTIGLQDTDLISHAAVEYISDQSWIEEEGQQLFDYQLYSEYLESLIHALVADLNQAVQFVSALQSYPIPYSSENRALTDYRTLMTNINARKAFLAYIMDYPEEFKAVALSNPYIINHEWEYNQVLNYYETAPTHIKTSIAAFLEANSSNIYPVAE